jgi:hypothetical protein
MGYWVQVGRGGIVLMMSNVDLGLPLPSGASYLCS